MSISFSSFLTVAAALAVLIFVLCLNSCTSFDDMTERHIAPLPDDPGGAAVDALFTPTGGKNRKP